MRFAPSPATCRARVRSPLVGEAMPSTSEPDSVTTVAVSSSARCSAFAAGASFTACTVNLARRSLSLPVAPFAT